MNSALVSVLLFSVFVGSQGLVCWQCRNAKSNDDCLEYGHRKICRDNQEACQTKVRKGSFGIEITKQCKQARACDNNSLQNPRSAWFTSQCNDSPEISICRCCCKTRLCNMNMTSCQEGVDLRLDDDERTCPPIEVRRNVKMNCFINSRKIPDTRSKMGVDTECRFSCKEGYVMIGRWKSTCLFNSQSNLARFDQPSPRCILNECTPEQVAPINGEVTCSDGQNISSVCKFSCEPGYKLFGSAIRTCLSSRKWTNRPPKCRKPLCNPPHTDPVNGLLVNCDNENNRLSACRFQCNEGHFMRGSPISRCVDNPKSFRGVSWSTPTPRCIPIVCLAQTAPSNGRIDCTNDAKLGSVCTFTCNQGYELTGNTQISCMDEFEDDQFGEWNLSPPICLKDIQCLNQAAPDNGEINCSDGRNEGSMCSFTCNSGYDLMGNNSNTCLDVGNRYRIGSWSSPRPTCREKVCTILSNPLNGVVSCSNSNKLLSNCSYQCNIGFYRSGPPSTICNEDSSSNTGASWSEDAPQCLPIRCLNQVAPQNGQVSCSDRTNVGSVCTFTCNPTYYLVGNTRTTCYDDLDGNEQGSWTLPRPTCQERVCTTRTNPVNGVVTCSNSNKLRSNCVYQCNTGFYRSGPPSTICNEDSSSNTGASWSEDAPQCLSIQCTNQVAPRNGQVTCSDGTNVGSDCTFTCNPTYYLVGNDRTTCFDDQDGNARGSWTSPRPTCQEKVCTILSNPLNGVVSCSNSNKLLSNCSYQCNIGFYRSGPPYTICNEDSSSNTRASWSEDAPQCLPIRCTNQVAPQNGQVSCSDRTNIGSDCTFRCNPTYYLVGSTSTTCFDDRDGNEQGSWTLPRPTCQERFCTIQNNPVNGVVTCSNSNMLLSDCSYQCNNGFYRSGPPSTMCNEDSSSSTGASWSEDAPRCLPVECTNQVAPRNGRVTCSDEANVGSVCTFTCNPTYYLVGNTRTTCFDERDGNARGRWTLPRPTCQERVCTTRINPVNGVVTCSNSNMLLSNCSYQCNIGFYRSGPPSTICNEDSLSDTGASWSEDAPQCFPIQCTNQVAPRNGQVTCSDGTNVGSDCTFTCNPTYYLVGNDRTTCFDDRDGNARGSWTSPRPICQESICSILDPPNNGRIDCNNNNRVGSVCSSQCNEGFALQGSSTTQCNQDLIDPERSAWSNLVPICLPIRCSVQEAPENGAVRCSDSSNYNSNCVFTCDAGYELIGSMNTRCTDDMDGDDVGRWLPESPRCQKITCSTINAPANGQIVCSDTNNLNSVCQFSCSNEYRIFPANHTTITCERNGWTMPIPCCSLSCPPHAVMDLVMVLDSSSSIGTSNWNIMKAFIRTFISSFRISNEFSRLAIFRYNRDIDDSSQILFNSFPNNETALLQAYDRIPYDGSGTRTGKAIKHVNDVVLKRRNGNRENVTDVVIIITDGRAQDEPLLITESQKLRESGALTYAVGIEPGRGRKRLDDRQLLEIAGEQNRVLLVEGGFEGLGKTLENELSAQVCLNRC